MLWEAHHFKMKVEFFQYERTSLEAYMENQIHKIQRNDVSYTPTPFKMLPSHNILEFCHHEQTNIPAFDHFTLEIKLMQHHHHHNHTHYHDHDHDHDHDQHHHHRHHHHHP